MADLKLKHIYKMYPGEKKYTVKDFTIDIENEEFVALIGPSGCGKSTMLRMIAGLEDITEGELYIGGELMNDVEPKDRDIAMVFQNYALYPHMTVYENMAFALKLRKVDKETIDKEVRRAAEILGIEEHLHKKPKAISGGQRQRVALGRAIVRKPRVFLMDEPLSNLDAKLRVQTRTEIIKLHEDLKTTFIYVTHDQTEAMTMADRIIIMDKGIIQQVDTPQKLYNDPDNMFVAGFIGSPQMNFLEGEVVEIDGFVRFKNEEFIRPVGKENADMLRRNNMVGKKAVLGVRPEHIDVDYSQEHEAGVPAYLDVIELLGSEAYLHLNTGGERVVARVEIGDDPIRRGNIKVLFEEDKLYFFNPEDGLRIK